MRQTNIFWVAIYLGGLEAVRTITEDSTTQNKSRQSTGPWKEKIKFEIERWGEGHIHDTPLAIAGVHGKYPLLLQFVFLIKLDFVLCAISIAIAIIHQPI